MMQEDQRKYLGTEKIDLIGSTLTKSCPKDSAPDSRRNKAHNAGYCSLLENLPSNGNMVDVHVADEDNNSNYMKIKTHWPTYDTTRRNRKVQRKETNILARELRNKKRKNQSKDRKTANCPSERGLAGKMASLQTATEDKRDSENPFRANTTDRSATRSPNTDPVSSRLSTDSGFRRDGSLTLASPLPRTRVQTPPPRGGQPS